MAFPQPFIEELKMRNNLEQIISSYVELKRAGSNLVACCPFHSERSPSFTVFPERNFYCFGCGAGGDVITFIMRAENLDYRSAVEFLADRAGIPMPENEDVFFKKKDEVLTRERNFAMNKAAARIFHENLMSPEGKSGLDYFLSRGLSMSTIRHFGLGFALNSFGDMLTKLTAKGFTPEELKAGFLCGLSQSGKYYDYFRNRVIFPIIDTSGNVVAFGGRVLDDSKPKYLNTSDTPVFKKSRNLFALNFAKNSAIGASDGNRASPGELILCEGYMDVIALHQAGFTGAVATLGTAITPEHARIISRYAKTLFVSYDSDNAGKNADMKAIKLLGEVGVEVKMLKVTGGAKDPDEYIRKYGSESFRKLMGASKGQIEYRLNEILEKYNLDLADDKAAALDEACALISTVYSETKREVYVMRLSELTGASKDSIYADIKRRMAKHIRVEKKEFVKSNEEKIRHYGDRINPDAMKNIKAAETEEQILGILLLFPEFIKGTPQLSDEDFVTAFNRRVYVMLKEVVEKSDGGELDISALNEEFTPEEMGRIHSMYRKRRELLINDLPTLESLVETLKSEKKKSLTPKGSDMSIDQLSAYLEEKRKQNTSKSQT